MLRRKYKNIEKYITFSVPSKTELGYGKTITYKQNLLLALDLCQAYNQVLLIIYLKFTAKCVKGIKQKKLNTQFYMA